jgi:hypothetical protein
MSVTADTRMPTASPTGPLRASLPVWGLFGRGLLVGIGELLIVPFPWVAAYFYRFVCDHVMLPDGRRLSFAGRGGDIWYVFMAIPALVWAIQAVWLVAILSSDDPAAFGQSSEADLIHVIGFAANLVFWALAVVILRWLVAHVKSPDGTISLTFVGGILPFIGWNILLILSVFTIIGWAWVLKFMLRWICRNVAGTLAFDFVGTGLEILWRVIVLALASMFIIPIPWMMRWYANWLISQLAVVPPGTGAP